MPSRGRKKPTGRSRVWFWGLTALVVGAIAFGAAQLDWSAVGAVLSQAEIAWFAAVCVVLSALPVLTAVEWRLIAARPAATDNGGLATLLPVAGLTYFLQTYLNAAVGYGTAMVRLVRVRNWSAGQAIGLVTVDQASEGISRILFCSIVLSAAAAALAVGPLGVGASLVLALAAVAWGAARAKSWVRRSVAGRLARRGHAAAVLDDVLAVLRLRSFAWGLALAMAKKGIKLAAIVAAERAVGVEGSLWTAVYFLAVLDCATVLPLVPGHLGVIESAAVTVYGTQGFSAEVGLSVGILYHAGLYLATTLTAAATAGMQAVSLPRTVAKNSPVSEVPETTAIAGSIEAVPPTERTAA
jgi:putative heme transporter